MVKLLLILLFLFHATPVFAEEQITPVQDFRKAEVVKILETGEKDFFESKRPYQLVEVKILDGSDKDTTVKIDHGSQSKLTNSQKVKVGDIVVVYRGGFNDQVDDYHIIDKYRLDFIWQLAAVFVGLVLIISRLKGLGAIVGLVISFLVILRFIVPQILQGRDPVLISILGSSFIMLTTIYLAHGFSKKTTTALISTIITLTLTGFLAAISVSLSKLSGLGDETAYQLTLNPAFTNLNLNGLFLGAIIIGTLGILDDVTTTQSSAVFELARLDKKLKLGELFKRGMVIGKDHISSVINTLVLAYAGVSLPLLLLIILNPSSQPIWFILNNESLSAEIIRTIVGSMGLVLAVPITTFIAAWVVSKKA